MNVKLMEEFKEKECLEFLLKDQEEKLRIAYEKLVEVLKEKEVFEVDVVLVISNVVKVKEVFSELEEKLKILEENFIKIDVFLF